MCSSPTTTTSHVTQSEYTDTVHEAWCSGGHPAGEQCTSPQTEVGPGVTVWLTEYNQPGFAVLVVDAGPCPVQIVVPVRQE